MLSIFSRGATLPWDLLPVVWGAGAVLRVLWVCMVSSSLTCSKRIDLVAFL